jgi:hypothetical protein
MGARFQFYPEHFDLNVAKAILLKTLTALPATDFSLVQEGIMLYVRQSELE